MQDSHFKWMLVVLVSLLLLTGFLFLYPNASEPTAAPHPQYPSILQSTGSYDAAGSWLGVTFGLLLIALIAFTSTIGLYREGKHSKLNSLMLKGIAVYALVWILIKVVDDFYMASSSPIFFGGFPLPTALLVYGIGVFPIVIIPLYYRNFSRDVFSEQNQQEFNQLLKEHAEEIRGQE